jgi:hypothetical protein
VHPEHNVDLLPHSSVKVTNECSYTSTPPICLHGVDRDNFTIVPLPWHWVTSSTKHVASCFTYYEVLLSECEQWPFTHRFALRTSLPAFVILLQPGTLSQKDWNICAIVLRRTIPKTDVSEHSYVLLPLDFDVPCPAQN